jgi:hypothetical protein
MPSPIASELRGPAADALLRFELTVQPESPLHAWRAQLCSEGGERVEFSSPIDLLRHLARLGQPAPPAGGLR